jgi:hypothetical protein
MGMVLETGPVPEMHQVMALVMAQVLVIVWTRFFLMVTPFYSLRVVMVMVETALAKVVVAMGLEMALGQEEGLGMAQVMVRGTVIALMPDQ